jgi:hypothetical protein
VQLSHQNIIWGLKATPKVWDPKNCKNCQNGNYSLSQWKMWVGTHIHLDKNDNLMIQLKNEKMAT